MRVGLINNHGIGGSGQIGRDIGVIIQRDHQWFIRPQPFSHLGSGVGVGRVGHALHLHGPVQGQQHAIHRAAATQGGQKLIEQVLICGCAHHARGHGPSRKGGHSLEPFTCGSGQEAAQLVVGLLPAGHDGRAGVDAADFKVGQGRHAGCECVGFVHQPGDGDFHGCFQVSGESSCGFDRLVQAEHAIDKFPARGWREQADDCTGHE